MRASINNKKWFFAEAVVALLMGWMIICRRDASAAAADFQEQEEILLSGFSSSSSPDSPEIRAMFVLGDSSVDCGDNNPFYPLFHRNFSLHPCLNPSHQTLLPHLLAKRIRLPYALPFYALNGSIDGLLKGVNFGSAQATIMYSSSRSHQSLNQQLRQVFEAFELLELQLGQERANHFIRSSLFYLSFGKDDFISYFAEDRSTKIPHANGSNSLTFSHVLVHQMINVMMDLYGANVKNIVCLGVLPLGCSPNALFKWHDSTKGDEKSCNDDINMAVLEYNTKLEEQMVDLNAKLVDSKFVFCDVYRAMLEFITKPKVYGFENVNAACCGSGHFGGLRGCLSADMACKNASAHVWWDLFNPTQAVNMLLADSAWSGKKLANICRPHTIQELVSSS